MSTIEQKTKSLPSGTWQIDAAHSHVGFAVDYLVGTFNGSVTPVAATLEVGDDGAATLRGAAAVTAIRVADEHLADHLLSPDFFDAERTPEVRFESTEIVRNGDQLTVVGELVIRGTSRPVTLVGTVGEPRQDAYGRTLLNLKLGTVVDRTEFGLNWNNPLPSGGPAVANEVDLRADLYLVKA